MSKAINEPGLVDIMAWDKEMERSQTIRLCWYGWEPESGVSKVEFFNAGDVSCHCIGPCKKCGFHYLNDKGEPLKRTDTPLCGTW